MTADAIETLVLGTVLGVALGVLAWALASKEKQS